MLSYIQTKWYQLSPASFGLAVHPFFQERSFVSQVYLQSAFVCLAFIRGHSVSFLQSERIARSRESIEDSCCLPAVLEPRSSIVLSYALTYSNLLSPTSQRLAVRPFSPERETYCILHVYKAFAFSSFYRIPSALPLQSFEDCTVTHTVYIMYEYIVRSGRIVPNKKRHRFRCLFLFSNSTASRNFNMGILRIPFLCGLRLAKTILCLRASPGLHNFLLYPFTILPTQASGLGVTKIAK